MFVDVLRYLAGHVQGRLVKPKRMEVGKGAYLAPSAKIDLTADGSLVSIGDHATISSDVRILCHDSSSNRRLVATWVAPVRIGDGAFVGAGATILPGVTIGSDAVVGAGSVVTSNVPARAVVAGAPAKVIGNVDELDTKRVEDMKVMRCFDISTYGGRGLPPRLTSELVEAARKDGGFFLVGRKENAYRARLQR